MQKSPNVSERNYLTLLMCVCWFAILFQFYLHINSGITAKPELLIRFFSYFTIDSNLLIAIASTVLACFPSTKLGAFSASTSVKSALTVYIVVVGLIYNMVLRFLWVLEGWSMVLNELLHVVVPFMFLIYWIYFVPKHQLVWRNLLPWLIYPLVYTIFVLVRGSFVNFYPYPFLNIAKLGLNQVLLNCIGVTLLFFFLSTLFIAIGRRKAKQLKA